MAVTLKDIAVRAGLSVSTISRIINNDTTKRASKETSDKVWEIVKELGYIPNQNARKLIKGVDEDTVRLKTKAIGCIFTSKDSNYTDPFFAEIARGIQDEIIKRGYVMGYTYSSYDMTDSALYNNISSHPVDGVIILGRFGLDTLKFLKNNNSNLIYCGINYVGADFDEVICDGYEAAKFATNYLIGLQHKKIGFLGTVQEKDQLRLLNEHRYNGYCDALRDAGMTLVKEFCRDTELTTFEGYRVARGLLEEKDKRPTALFCANDAVAIGAIRAANELGIIIPEQLSVIGIDDIEMASFTTPSLTTIRIPKEELGRFAVKILIDRIEGGHELPIRMNLPFELLERHSCSALDK